MHRPRLSCARHHNRSIYRRWRGTAPATRIVRSARRLAQAEPAQRPRAYRGGLTSRRSRGRQSNADCKMCLMLPSRQITSINFADAFAHSLLSITVKNPPDLLVEAFVAHGPTPGGYSCGLAALAGYAGVAFCFLQAIEPTHRFSLVGRTDEKAWCWTTRSYAPSIFRLCRWLPEIRDERCATIHTA